MATKRIATKRLALALAFTGFLMAPLMYGAPAQAQRTWVSGVGDDANPCSRTAPCKTFAGAISKTPAGGEINCIDPGGFGGVTITKAIAIKCETGTAGVLVSGTNGITVAAGTGDVVILRGLDIEGINSGTNGINFIGGLALFVDDCEIRGFNTNAINFAPNNANASLFVQGTIVDANNGGGILIAPTGGFTASATLMNVQMTRNTFGLRVNDNGTATAFHSAASGNTHNGFLAASVGSPAVLELTHVVTSNNGTNGIATSGAGASVTMAYTSIFGNVTGVNTGAGGTVSGTLPATNANAGNGTNGAPNGVAISLQ
jgi:hypothetical protein